MVNFWANPSWIPSLKRLWHFSSSHFINKMGISSHEWWQTTCSYSWWKINTKSHNSNSAYNWWTPPYVVYSRIWFCYEPSEHLDIWLWLWLWPNVLESYAVWWYTSQII
jgi:hypothetical protein